MAAVVVVVVVVAVAVVADAIVVVVVDAVVIDMVHDIDAESDLTGRGTGTVEYDIADIFVDRETISTDLAVS